MIATIAIESGNVDKSMRADSFGGLHINSGSSANLVDIGHRISIKGMAKELAQDFPRNRQALLPLLLSRVNELTDYPASRELHQLHPPVLGPAGFAGIVL